MNSLSRFIHFGQAFLFETPDPAGGGGAGTVPAQGTAPQGQGQPTQGQQPAGFRQYFPNVPEEHWALIEPHVGQIEAHTTQLQQQLAPFKAITDAGYDPQTVTGLVNFDRKFNAAPLDTWLELGQMLQQQQGPNGPALDPNVDLEYLAAIARGEDPDAGSVPGNQPGADPVAGDQQNPVVQQLMGTIQGLQQQVETLQTELQSDRTERQTVVQDRLYDNQKNGMREALKTAGWPEELLTDETLNGAIITFRGNFQAATKALIDQRSAMLKGFTDQRNQPLPPTNLPNGAPNTPSRDVRPRDRDDPWKGASRTASARLARLNGQG